MHYFVINKQSASLQSACFLVIYRIPFFVRISIFFFVTLQTKQAQAKMNFTPLHVHSQYSVLDGMSKVPDIVDKCLRIGMGAVALTDHGNMYGIKELLDYCKKVNGKNKDTWDAKQEELAQAAA